jgi:cytochrome c553
MLSVLRGAGLLAAIVLSLASAVSQAKGDAQAGQNKAAACGACHGPDGNSVNPEWPRLAAQVPEYIIKQIHDFKAGRRGDPLMSPMAAPLTEQDIEDLAAYFSAQKLAPPATSGSVAAGEKLYLKGKSRPVVIACVGCHGMSGNGNAQWGKSYAAPPTMLAPAIGGQQAAYLVKQLKAYREAARSNDVGHVMRDIAANLSDEEIAALADYIATLKR